MKNLKQTMAILIFFGLTFSCEKENIEPIHQISISDFDEQQIKESSEFIEMQSLNSTLLVSITRKLVSNPKLSKNIIEQNYTDSEIIEKLEIKDELFQYDQQIIDLTNKIISEHPVFNNLDIIEQKLIINGLLQVDSENPSEGNTFSIRSFNQSNNPCQQQFERDFQYIHGQYDSAIMGATVAITSGGITQNPIPVYIGGITSLVAVGRAIYKIAVAIDDFNDCMDESGGSGQPLIFEPH